MGRLFGTDGVRGIANKDLTNELAMQIGAAAAEVLLKESKSAKPSNPPTTNLHTQPSQQCAASAQPSQSSSVPEAHVYS